MLSAESYKDTTTTRGYKYHYYFASAKDSKPTLLFCHGFPSTSQDWRLMVPFFEKQGYGIIAPDMLGYGGTDKPTDPAVYKGTLMAKDMVDILDAEKIAKVIVIGHDWGVIVVSRLLNVAPERIHAYAFLALSYILPDPEWDYEKTLERNKELVGRKLFGYWAFFSREDGAKKIEDNWDSFFGVIWSADVSAWRKLPGDLSIEGMMDAIIGKTFPLPSYITAEDKKAMTDALLGGGLTAPTCYYKVQLNGGRREDDRTIPQERYIPPVSSPIFYAGGTEDSVCIPSMQKQTFEDARFKDHQITIREYDAGHWFILSHADELNADLAPWIEGVVAQIAKQ